MALIAATTVAFAQVNLPGLGLFLGGACGHSPSL
jgi:hypothetical protein